MKLTKKQTAYITSCLMEDLDITEVFEQCLESGLFDAIDEDELDDNLMDEIESLCDAAPQDDRQFFYDTAMNY